MSKEAIKNLLMDFMADYDPNKWSNDDVYEKYAEKIDNVRSMGEIIAFTELTKKVKDLEHRLANCIEPKFKQGDKCYGIIDTFAYTDVFPVEIRDTHLLYEVWDGEDTTKQHSTRIFATEEEARAKLEELKK